MDRETECLMSLQRQRAREWDSMAWEDRETNDPLVGGDDDDSLHGPDLDARIADEDDYLRNRFPSSSPMDRPPSQGRYDLAPPTPDELAPPTLPASIPVVKVVAVGKSSSSSSSGARGVPIAVPERGVSSTASRPNPVTGAVLAAGVSDTAVDDTNLGDPLTLTSQDQVFLEDMLFNGSELPPAGRRRKILGGDTSDADFAAMVEKCTQAAVESFRECPEIPDDTSHMSIMRETAKVTERLQRDHPEWPDHQIRLVCAALATYRLRLVDMFYREHVLLLWIIEGRRYLRVHAGIRVVVEPV